MFFLDFRPFFDIFIAEHFYLLSFLLSNLIIKEASAFYYLNEKGVATEFLVTTPDIIDPKLSSTIFVY